MITLLLLTSAYFLPRRGSVSAILPFFREVDFHPRCYQSPVLKYAFKAALPARKKKHAHARVLGVHSQHHLRNLNCCVGQGTLWQVVKKAVHCYGITIGRHVLP
jgi:hypothetical protein